MHKNIVVFPLSKRSGFIRHLVDEINSPDCRSPQRRFNRVIDGFRMEYLRAGAPENDCEAEIQRFYRQMEIEGERWLETLHAS